MIRFVIPGVPVAKGRARIGRTRSGQTVAFTPAKTRSYEALVALAAQQAMAGRAPYAKEQTLFLRVDAYLPVPASWSQKKRQAALDGAVRPSSRPDLDNFVKAALDGLNGILFADDSSVVQIWAAKMYGDVPRLVVEAAAI
jgi:Holliday junction resolvase RusA-like endonuclease